MLGSSINIWLPICFQKNSGGYIGRHLRILSGFYGILRADDAVVPYRLEMQARLAAGGAGICTDIGRMQYTESCTGLTGNPGGGAKF